MKMNKIEKDLKVLDNIEFLLKNGDFELAYSEAKLINNKNCRNETLKFIEETYRILKERARKTIKEKYNLNEWTCTNPQEVNKILK